MTTELVGLIKLIKSIGYVGVFATIFSESGILFGVLLPGDTLLFTVGVLARQGYFNIWVMIVGCFLSAFFGNLFGYAIGKRYGLPFARKYASRFISEEKLEATNQFFTKHGVTTIVLARFFPIIRTIAPFLAGVIRMDYRNFVIRSALGALLWAGGLPIAGYYLGKFIPDGWIEILILPILIFAVGAVVMPYVMNAIKTRKAKKIEVKNDTDIQS
jgi:membrane-associated protein